jgi:hypothetical protein
VIVIVGNPAYRAVAPPGPAGRAALIAVAAAEAGARVELVGRAGDDAPGDALLIALAQRGVGHAALLRDPARPTPLAFPAPAGDEENPALDPEGVPDPAPSREIAAGPVLEAADVALGLRYLTEFAVLVVADGTDDAVAAAAVDAAAYAGARIVVVVPAGAAGPRGLPDDAVVLEAPADDPGGAFAMVVGRLAAALDRGERPRAALASAVAAVGWEPASGA